MLRQQHPRQHNPVPSLPRAPRRQKRLLAFLAPRMMVAALLVNVGMWMERFVIIVASLGRDFLPSSWGMFWPSLTDVLMLAGSFGLFFTLFLLFIRYLPLVAMAEVKGVLPPSEPPAFSSGAH